MTQDELIERFAVKGYTKKAARIIIKDFADILTESLLDGESVTLIGFGTFSVISAKPKKIHDVSTGTMRIVPAHAKPKFVSSLRLRRFCRQGYADSDDPVTIDAEDQ